MNRDRYRFQTFLLFPDHDQDLDEIVKPSYVGELSHDFKDLIMREIDL